MGVLIVLITAFGFALTIIKLSGHHYDFYKAGRIAMSAMLLFTAMGHFMFTKGMTMMLPDFLPFKTELVYLTGIIEIAAAFGLLVPKLHSLTGWLLIIFFVLILPSNIKTAIEHIDMYKGNYQGGGISYLWFRIPLQMLFIIWIYVCAIKQPNLANRRKVFHTLAVNISNPCASGKEFDDR
jgi:uncharacterized membrane protein